MNRRGIGIFGIVVGLVLNGTIAEAENGPMLTGKGHLGVSLESELSSRDMKTDGQKDRERVARQSLELAYGLINNLELYAKLGLGKITFEETDLSGETRPQTGIGFRSTVPFYRGYFAGLSAQYRFGRVSKFDQNNATLTMEDQWTETDAGLFVGTKDLIGAPEPDLRFYAGMRFSKRSDKLTPEVGTPSTMKQDSSTGSMIGMDLTDQQVFRFNAELGTGDRNNILIRFGIMF
jgi:hypothetical protein